MPKHRPLIRNTALRQARIEHGWSQQQVAECIGTNAFTVARWERGYAVPGPYYRQKLIELFARPPALLGLLPPGALPESASVPLQPDALSAAVPSATSAIHDPLLPPPPTLTTGLIGRETLLAQLKMRLLSGETLILSALHGLPGVGKTALALALAHDPEVRAHFADGVLWAGLGQTPHVQEALARWGTLLGLSPADAARLTTTQAWAQTLRAAIGTRRFLFVLDDAWDVEAVLACQVGGATCAYLVMTRRLDLALQVAGAGLATVPELGDADGLALLARLAPQVVEAEPDAARALVQAVGGLPLGLLLVGKHLAREAFTDQPRRVRAALERLQRGAERLRLAQPQAPLSAHLSLPVGTPLSLQASIGLSLAALPAEAQILLAALALFPPKPNSFSEEAALTVSAGMPETLDALVDAGLVESLGSERYTLHQTIMDYARLQDGLEEAEARLVEWGLRVIASTPVEAPVFDQERANLLAALDLAFVRGQHQALVQGVTQWADCFFTRGWYETGLELLRRASTAARAMGNLPGLLSALASLGRLANARGTYAEAEAAYEEGIPLARQAGQLDWLLELLTARGVIWYERGARAQAEAAWLECQALARQESLPHRLSQPLHLLGVLASAQGNLVAAEGYYQEALQVAEAVGHLRHMSDTLQGLAVIAARRGDYPQAGRYLQQGLTLARQLHYRERMRGLLANLGAMAIDQGDWDTAQVYLGEALSLARATGHRQGLCHVLVNLGGVAAQQGQVAQARKYLEEGLALARELGHQERLCALLRLGGEVALREGDLEAATRYLAEGISLARALADRWRLSAALCISGQLQLARHAWDEAETAFAEALDLACQVESAEREAGARYGLAQVAAGRGQHAEARRQAEESLRLFEQIGYHQAAEVKQWLGKLERSAEEARQQHAETLVRWNGHQHQRPPRTE